MEPKMEHQLIRDFRRDVKIIFLELDDLLFKLKLNGEDVDMEDTVHEIRVNFRKLISLLYFHKPLIRKKHLKRLNENLGLMLRSFGAERTHHVLMKNIERYQDAGEKGNALKGIVEREITLRRNPDRHHMDPMTFRVTYEGALKTLLGYGRNIFRGDISLYTDPITFTMIRYQEMMRELRHLEDTVDFEEKKSIHQLRVAAKNIYYTLKSKEESLGELAVRRGVYLKEIQNIGGKIHDTDVNLRILSGLSVNEEEENILKGFLDYLNEDREKKVTDLKDWIRQE